MGTPKNQFICNFFPRTDLSKFDPNKYFAHYHFFELYDENKIYLTEKFSKDFGFGELTYYYKFFSLFDNNSNNRLDYVIAEEELDDTQMNLLSKHCQCDYHIKSYWNPLKYFTCQCCVGCIESPFPRQHVINKTREFINKI